jgi:8-oxo-dGTP pyrophosphatase MutT (NUDIX family)
MNEDKRITCGILLCDLDPLRFFLVRESGVYQRHFTGEPGNWRIPKGGLKKGKTAFETALCEFEEETGISLDPVATFEDLGLHPIRVRLSRKTLTDSELNQKKVRMLC